LLLGIAKYFGDINFLVTYYYDSAMQVSIYRQHLVTFALLGHKSAQF